MTMFISIYFGQLKILLTFCESGKIDHLKQSMVQTSKSDWKWAFSSRFLIFQKPEQWRGTERLILRSHGPKQMVCGYGWSLVWLQWEIFYQTTFSPINIAMNWSEQSAWTASIVLISSLSGPATITPEKVS